MTETQTSVGVRSFRSSARWPCRGEAYSPLVESTARWGCSGRRGRATGSVDLQQGREKSSGFEDSHFQTSPRFPFPEFSICRMGMIQGYQSIQRESCSPVTGCQKKHALPLAQCLLKHRSSEYKSPSKSPQDDSPTILEHPPRKSAVMTKSMPDTMHHSDHSYSNFASDRGGARTSEFNRGDVLQVHRDRPRW